MKQELTIYGKTLLEDWEHYWYFEKKKKKEIINLKCIGPFQRTRRQHTDW